MRAQEEPTLIDELLHEQRLLTAVARFAQRHEEQALPHQARYYRDLIPLSLPSQGQQYAFEVDLDQCSGCKACVTACHNLNGLDANETWRSVGFIQGGSGPQPVHRFVTTSCHHCVDPACLNGCPVNAYEKDAVTGIVRHLDDQCIGCQYCVLKCPYDVPKYHAQKGIVRKCDMCSSRLAVAEAPACVQACPNEAIRITVVDQHQVADRCRNHDTEATHGFLPGAPEPGYTLPTTNYLTKSPLPANMRSGDFNNVKPEPAHLPLILMLVLTQLSVGLCCLNSVSSFLWPADLTASLRSMPTLAMVFGFIGLAASIFHLGRPLLAWKVFLGLKTSWLSREILVFAIFIVLASTHAALFWLGGNQTSSGIQNMLGLGAALSGLLGVFCSHMIYHDTRRLFWQGSRTAGRFFGTSLLLGIATTLCAIIIASQKDFPARSALQPFTVGLCAVLITASAAKLGWELSLFSHLRREDLSPLKRSALLMRRELKEATMGRFLCGMAGGILLPVFLLYSAPRGLLSPASFVLLASGVFLLSLLGELLERYLFFAAVVAPKMPGSFVR